MRLSPSLSTPQLTPQIRDVLCQLSENKRKVSADLKQRAKIILLSADGVPVKKICELVDLSRNNVANWRKKFIQYNDYLLEIPESEPKLLKEKIESILDDLPRSGTPSTFSVIQKAQIIKLACNSPSDYGYMDSQWNLKLLCRVAVEQKICDSISPSTMYRILDASALHPHKSQYWLHSKEKDEDGISYIIKVQHINSLYATAEMIRKLTSDGSECDYRIYSFDEMTGIQALMRIHPDKPSIPGMDAKIEFEYKRMGTVSWIGFYDVVTGRVADPYLKKTRTEEDFVEAISAIIASEPDKHYTFCGDNLNIHVSASLVEYVAHEIGYTGDLGVKNVRGILKNVESRVAFLTDPTHRIRFMFVPKHCSWLNQIEILFGIVNQKYLKRTSFESVEDLINGLIEFIKQYNDLYAHHFKWDVYDNTSGNTLLTRHNLPFILDMLRPPAMLGRTEQAEMRNLTHKPPMVQSEWCRKPNQ